ILGFRGWQPCWWSGERVGPLGARKTSPPAFRRTRFWPGIRGFFARTALPDGSFRPGIDPAYPGLADSAYSDLAPLTYAVILHRTFGWKLPDEAKTRAFLLSRQGRRGLLQRQGHGRSTIFPGAAILHDAGPGRKPGKDANPCSEML